MAKLRKYFNPLRLTFAALIIFVTMSISGNTYSNANYIIALGAGGTLGLITLLVEYRKNTFFKDDSSFGISIWPYNISLVIVLLGALLPKSQEMFFIALEIGFLMVFWIGLLTVRIAWKRRIVWE